ncbi:Heavy metal-associated domain containing protein [Trema orientale]|uniref:Heavy metal-associated domain containing protein n=1 Tax=Trema orientale TaxID=63057 RepID=A0A2P5BP27_TREOI|nr:Heavy metal-associated domain containing protein [Trema orientale]
MAKEVDLKKVELKVFVNCCDGCRRKIKKVLRSIDGVFRIEIDPLQPKVTVLGNVDPQVLIKKLCKAGKQAEVVRQLGNENAPKTEERGNPERGNEKKKCRASSTVADESLAKEIMLNGQCTERSNKSSQHQITSKSGSETGIVVPTSTGYQHQLMNCSSVQKMQSLPVHINTTNEVRNCTQHYCYVVDPYSSTIPCYAIPPPYVAAPVLVTPQNYPYERKKTVLSQIPPPPPPPPPPPVGDYFSDDNTMGCHVM